MKTTILPHVTPAALVLLALLLLHTSGCEVGYSENTNARPWNEPQGLDMGLPGRDNRRSVYRR